MSRALDMYFVIAIFNENGQWIHVAENFLGGKGLCLFTEHEKAVDYWNDGYSLLIQEMINSGNNLAGQFNAEIRGLRNERVTQCCNDENNQYILIDPERSSATSFNVNEYYGVDQWTDSNLEWYSKATEIKKQDQGGKKNTHAQKLAEKTISDIRESDLSADELRSMLVPVEERLEAGDKMRKLIQKTSPDKWDYDLFYKTLLIASDGNEVPVTQEEWDIMLPHHVEKTWEDLLVTLDEGQEAFQWLKTELERDIKSKES